MLTFLRLLPSVLTSEDCNRNHSAYADSTVEVFSQLNTVLARYRECLEAAYVEDLVRPSTTRDYLNSIINIMDKLQHEQILPLSSSDLGITFNCIITSLWNLPSAGELQSFWCHNMALGNLLEAQRHVDTFQTRLQDQQKERDERHNRRVSSRVSRRISDDAGGAEVLRSIFNDLSAGFQGFISTRFRTGSSAPRDAGEASNLVSATEPDSTKGHSAPEKELSPVQVAADGVEKLDQATATGATDIEAYAQKPPGPGEMDAADHPAKPIETGTMEVDTASPHYTESRATEPSAVLVVPVVDRTVSNAEPEVSVTPVTHSASSSSKAPVESFEVATAKPDGAVADVPPSVAAQSQLKVVPDPRTMNPVEAAALTKGAIKDNMTAPHLETPSAAPPTVVDAVPGSRVGSAKLAAEPEAKIASNDHDFDDPAPQTALDDALDPESADAERG
ncbi:hypothetical protein BC628DRAFT_793363 [Trametes gibbosa]|nr:hypothetical protein BC628DRAFT_793363 [Trametes gibbosa]